MTTHQIVVRGLLFVSLVLVAGCAQERSENKVFRPGEIWPDNNGVHINAHGGGILYQDGVYYWFGEHKIEGEIGNTAQVGVRVYSSENLYDWTDRGVALSVVTDDPNHELAAGSIIERPKVIYNDSTGKYVMWFHLEPKGMGYKGARSGVAVADQVTGPYTFVGSFRPNAGVWPINVQDVHKIPNPDVLGLTFTGGSVPAHPDTLNILGRDFEGGQMARDMTLFVDDDGTAYHIYASEENSTLHISQLSDDYLSPAGKYVRVFVGRFMEAPALFKRGDRYYLIASGCTGWDPNAARSAVAPSIWGPWKELGNPAVGPDSALTFRSQSTYVLPVAGKEDAFIFMADRWRPENPIDGRYVWLPIQFEGERVVIEWLDEWNLDWFDRQP